MEAVVSAFDDYETTERQYVHDVLYYSCCREQQHHSRACQLASAVAAAL
jgi:hypothetical protein